MAHQNEITFDLGKRAAKNNKTETLAYTVQDDSIVAECTRTDRDEMRVTKITVDLVKYRELVAAKQRNLVAGEFDFAVTTEVLREENVTGRGRAYHVEPISSVDTLHEVAQSL